LREVQVALANKSKTTLPMFQLSFILANADLDEEKKVSVTIGRSIP